MASNLSVVPIIVSEQINMLAWLGVMLLMFALFIGILQVMLRRGDAGASDEDMTASKPKDTRERFYENIKRKKDAWRASQRKHP